MTDTCMDHMQSERVRRKKTGNTVKEEWCVCQRGGGGGATKEMSSAPEWAPAVVVPLHLAQPLKQRSQVVAA